MTVTKNNPAVSGQGYSGQLGVWAGTSDFNAQMAVIKQVLGETRTATLVQIVKVTNNDEVSAVGTCDVLPLVNMLDGLGTAYKHGNVFGICYFRLQGGENAIIMDPKEGDIGVAIISDRDISVIKKTKKQGNPGSRRRFSLPDAIYIGGVLNGIPKQYVRFSADGIDLKDKNENTLVMDADGIKINGVLFDRDQKITEIEEATSKSGVTLTQHQHAQGNDSNGDTEVDTDPPHG